MSFRPIHSLIVLFLVLSAAAEDPVPTAWPEQFHALMLMNKSGSLEIVDLWYDWVNGRNFNIIQKQLGKVTYDLEWNNGTSFYYSLDASRTCRTVHFEVGILRPNWLDGAKYLGQRHVNGFLCNVWEKVEFLWYYEDVVTKRPVQWIFYTGREAHVMTFEVGAVLEDEKWQAPVYCFNKEEDKKTINRLSTGDRMHSWNVGISPHCVLCNDPWETRDHLFFLCPFSTRVWENLSRGLLQLRYTNDFGDLSQLISGSAFSATTRFLVRYVFQAVLYSIWCERNGRRHGQNPKSSEQVTKAVDRVVRNRLLSLRGTGNKKLDDGLLLWLATRS